MINGGESFHWKTYQFLILQSQIMISFYLSPWQCPVRGKNFVLSSRIFGSISLFYKKKYQIIEKQFPLYTCFLNYYHYLHSWLNGVETLLISFERKKKMKLSLNILMNRCDDYGVKEYFDIKSKLDELLYQVELYCRQRAKFFGSRRGTLTGNTSMLLHQKEKNQIKFLSYVMIMERS